jgi:hypothetical protein
MNQLALDLQPADQSYRTISLTQGQVAIVDASDFEWINQWKWLALPSPARNSPFRAIRTENKKTIYMHRRIISAPDGIQVDHINGDTLFNSRSNLRLATQSQNQCNKILQKNSTTGFKGVHFHKVNGVWTSYITVSGKQLHLGCFASPEAAHDAYKAAALQHFGEFARTA